jgi:hypothetical protein
MAYLQLFPNGDREIRDLPFCCMRCGAPAATIVRQRFSTKHHFVTVDVPMCNKHRFHWLISAFLVVGSLMATMPLFYCGMFLFAALADNVGESVAIAAAVVLWVVPTVAAIAFAILIHRRQIRIVDQFHDSFVLTNVCAEFVEELETLTEKLRPTLVDCGAHFTWRFSEERFKAGGDEGYRR